MNNTGGQVFEKAHQGISGSSKWPGCKKKISHIWYTHTGEKWQSVFWGVTLSLHILWARTVVIIKVNVHESLCCLGTTSPHWLPLLSFTASETMRSAGGGLSRSSVLWKLKAGLGSEHTPVPP